MAMRESLAMARQGHTRHGFLDLYASHTQGSLEG